MKLAPLRSVARKRTRVRVAPLKVLPLRLPPEKMAPVRLALLKVLATSSLAVVASTAGGSALSSLK